MAAGGLLLAACTSLFTQFEPSEVVVSIDRSQVIGTSHLEVGVTHMQASANPDGDPQAVARARELLRAGAVFQNQHIMGFGANDPWPDPRLASPSQWSWESLDQRVRLMRETGGRLVLTLCCAPTWMVDPNWRSGTDWSKLEWAPLQEREDDFARLCAEVARRYRDVAYFQVWNEFKGMWNAGASTWDFVRYTRLYNKVWTAVKAVRPDAKIGGPYLVIEGSGAADRLGFPQTIETASPITQRDRDVLAYWMRYKTGADFIAVDRSVTTRTDAFRYSEADLMRLTPLFGEVVRQIQRLPGYRAEPIWMAEDNVWYEGKSDEPSEAFQAAALASMLKHELEAGLSVSLRWSPEQQMDSGQPTQNRQNWFTNTHRSGGGQPLLAYAVYRIFREQFSPGTPLVGARASLGSLEVLASEDAVLLINTRVSAIRVALGAKRFSLQPYEVRLVANAR